MDAFTQPRTEVKSGNTHAHTHRRLNNVIRASEHYESDAQIFFTHQKLVLNNLVPPCTTINAMYYTTLFYIKL